jgi:hypothetical protein
MSSVPPSGEVLDEFADESYAGPGPLFVGDTGQLTEDVRETLVTLLKRRYISSDRQPKDWRIVLDNEAALRTRLNDLFLDLVINRDYEVAYKRQAVSETGSKYPTLLYDQAYGREETILLVHLRWLVRSRQAEGDDAVFVDREQLVEEVGTFQPTSATNLVRDERAARNAVDSLLKNDILLRTREADRYRVAPIIEVLLPVERVQELAAWLRRENTGDRVPGPGPDGAGTDDADDADDAEREYDDGEPQ